MGNFMLGVSRVTSVFNIKTIWEEEKEEAGSKKIVYSEVLL